MSMQQTEETTYRMTRHTTFHLPNMGNENSEHTIAQACKGAWGIYVDTETPAATSLLL